MSWLTRAPVPFSGEYSFCRSKTFELKQTEPTEKNMKQETEVVEKKEIE